MTVDIERVPILPLRMVNAHVLFTPEGCVVVDAGLPGSLSRFERVLGRRGRTLADVKLIVVTHAHVDHAGGAHALREATRAPILAHADDLPYYRRERPMEFCPTGWAGRLLASLGANTEPYRAFEPDILLRGEDDFALEPYGLDGWVRATAGHTEGSVSVELDTGDMLVGDLLASGLGIGGIAFNGRPRRPPFEDDPARVGEHLHRMVEGGGRRFFVGHGGPLGAEAVRRHAAHLTAGSA